MLPACRHAEAQDFHPTVEAMDAKKLFCESADYDWELIQMVL